MKDGKQRFLAWSMWHCKGENSGQDWQSKGRCNSVGQSLSLFLGDS
jgi:hypothetical protein